MLHTSQLSLKLPPSLPGLPLLGSAAQFVSANGIAVEFLQRALREHGDLVHFKVMNQAFYLVGDPKLVRQVLLERVAEFHKIEAIAREHGSAEGSSAKPRGLARFLGQGILTAGYEAWRPQRKLIQPLLQPKHIANYAETMARMGEQLLARWQPGEQRNIHADMTQVTMWIVAETMFGINVEQSAELAAAGRAAQKLFVEELASLLPAWLTGREARAARINAVLTDLVHQIMAERRARGYTDRYDLLSVLMATRDENGQPLSDELLRDNILTMFFAGHETTANTLTWALYYLARNPAVRAELEREVDQVLAGGRPPTVADLPQLAYTLMVIKETMRIEPIVPMLSRVVLTDTELGGYQLKAGSFVLVAPYVLHRDPRRWAAPEVFDPQRFSPENEPKIEKYGYIPFGAGPRICVGNHFALMEAQILLAQVVSRYRLHLAPGTKVEPLRQVTTSPKYGLPMLVERRT